MRYTSMVGSRTWKCPLRRKRSGGRWATDDRALSRAFLFSLAAHGLALLVAPPVDPVITRMAGWSPITARIVQPRAVLKPVARPQPAARPAALPPTHGLPADANSVARFRLEVIGAAARS